MAPSPTRDVWALAAPGIAAMSMRDVAFFGLAPMRMPLVAGEAGMVALLKSMREVDDFTALISKGLSSLSPAMAKPPLSSRLWQEYYGARTRAVKPFHGARKQRVALCPPNPSELFRQARILALRALLGT